MRPRAARAVRRHAYAVRGAASRAQATAGAAGKAAPYVSALRGARHVLQRITHAARSARVHNLSLRVGGLPRPACDMRAVRAAAPRA